MLAAVMLFGLASNFFLGGTTLLGGMTLGQTVMSTAFSAGMGGLGYRAMDNMIFNRSSSPAEAFGYVFDPGAMLNDVAYGAGFGALGYGFGQWAASKNRMGVPDAPEGTGGKSSTGTVWDDITPTQANIEGTNIPKSFELRTGAGKYWVNPNATKHMAEYSSRFLSHGQPITEQQLLTGFRGSVGQAISNGYTYNVPIRSGNWELIFSPARHAGLSPVIKHALYLP